ncbi:MAG: PKD domain-containing protein [Candidatus Altiarchaeota archaeon]
MNERFATKIFLVTIAITLAMIHSSNVNAQCSAEGCKSPQVINQEIYFGEPCTELGVTIVNYLERCKGEVKFFVDENEIKCDNSPQISLDINESAWVLCKSQEFKKICHGLHTGKVYFCNQVVLFTYGKLSAKILSPMENSSFYQGQDIIFSGIGNEGIHKDSEYEYQWTSSIDGFLSKEKDFIAKNLSLGRHEITFIVYKPESNEFSKDVISIQIKKIERFEEPSYGVEKFFIDLLLPVSKTYIKGEKINFRAFAALGKEPYNYEWFSSIDGFLSNEKNFSTKSLSVGKHEISLKVTDANLQTLEEKVEIEVMDSQLRVLITPLKDRIYSYGVEIPIEYKILGGKEPYILNWYLDGRKIDNIRELPVGKHILSLTVFDATENSASDSVNLTIVDICNFDDICNFEQGENFLNCPEDCPSGARDNYCDAQSDSKCDPDCERKLDRDCLCNNNAICEIEFENFLNCPKDCPSGARDNYCDAQSDSKCDPDCENNEDIDCKKDYSNYIILFVFTTLLIFSATKIRKYISR